MSNFAIEEISGSIITDDLAFFLDDNISEKAKIYRLLAGDCLVTSEVTGASKIIKWNYFLGSRGPRGISFLESDGVTISDYSEYIKSSRYENRNFYVKLLGEIENAVLYVERGHHAKAFVFIYRAYECLAYAFPMIYAAKTSDFVGTFENLKKWLNSTKSEDSVGELKFHKNFLQKLYDGEAEVNLTIDVSLRGDQLMRETIFNALALKIMKWDSPAKYHGATAKPDKICVNFLDFQEFIVGLRNRFFHYSHAHNGNITSSDLIDPDLFFSMINKPCLHYIAKIYHSIFMHSMQASR